MLEVWGRRTAVRYADGRITTTPLGVDDDVAMDVRVCDLRDACLAEADSGDLLILLYFRAPDYVIKGVATRRNPATIFLEPEVFTQAATLVRAIGDDLLEMRRIVRQRPNLAPPRPVPGHYGPIRPDVSRATERMRTPGLCARELAALHAYARPDEYVLECAPCGHRGAPGLVVITTLRLLFVSAGATYEFPVAALDRSDVAAPPGSVATLRISDGNTDLEFVSTEAEDLLRVDGAVRLACEIEHVDGSIVMARPSSLDLFGEWQLLVERRKLGMVDTEQFKWEGVGILRAMPK
ncbi:hypothetical protein [Nocardia cerradoensis]|uniref:hypothetical protein n=1 Tax=Nocardia cerradoensis TaxID=85688 RepID=UPI0002FF50EE|nr:hypothetical protein [Nocardia cerradoensis]NKY46158.1 hypothetical protein [Nocardia cerradoensis]